MKRIVLGLWGLGLIILFIMSATWFAVGDWQRGLGLASGFLLWIVVPLAMMLGVVVFRSVLLEEEAASKLPAFTVKQLDELINDADLTLTDDE